MELKIEDNKTAFYQWDTGQKLILEDAGGCGEVHFCRSGEETALVCPVREEGSRHIADVPNILLQEAGEIHAYLFQRREDGSETVCWKGFAVLPRPKPDSYAYTETEVLDYANLARRLEKLEGEGLEKALEAYLKENPVQTGATAEEAAQIQQNRENIERLSDSKLDASKLPEAVEDALTQAKQSGEFKGDPGSDYVLTEADKQKIAELAAPLVDIPAGKSVISYKNATEIPLENCAQYIVYGSDAGMVSLQIGEWETAKVDCQLATRDDIVWLLWVETAAGVQGSIITTAGKRRVIDLKGDCSKIKVSATTPAWVVIKIS